VLHLERALGDVVDEAVAGDVPERGGLLDVARVAAHDDAELDFVVELHRAARAHDRIVGAADRARRLDEQGGLLGERHADLGRVVGVVEPDADHLADGGQRAAQSRSAAHEGQAGQLDGAQPAQGRRCERGR
jgi:hypothetical protein